MKIKAFLIGWKGENMKKDFVDVNLFIYFLFILFAITMKVCNWRKRRIRIKNQLILQLYFILTSCFELMYWSKHGINSYIGFLIKKFLFIPNSSKGFCNKLFGMSPNLAGNWFPSTRDKSFSENSTVSAWFSFIL